MNTGKPTRRSSRARPSRSKEALAKKAAEKVRKDTLTQAEHASTESSELPRRTLSDVRTLRHGDVIVCEKSLNTFTYTVDVVIGTNAYVTSENKNLSSNERRVYTQEEVSEYVNKGEWRLPNV